VIGGDGGAGEPPGLAARDARGGRRGPSGRVVAGGVGRGGGDGVATEVVADRGTRTGRRFGTGDRGARGVLGHAHGQLGLDLGPGDGGPVGIGHPGAGHLHGQRREQHGEGRAGQPEAEEGDAGSHGPSVGDREAIRR
jgi:hypothetical protein